MAQETITLKLTIDGQQAEKLLASLGLKGKTSGDQVGAGMGKARQSVQGLQTDLARAGLAIEGVQRIYGLLGQSVRPFLDAAREQAQAQQVLRGTSRLLGTSYEDLVGVASQINDQFNIGQQASNGMAAELAKLESQAGTSGKSLQATGAILDLAAARGFTADQAMQAVSQAMLGIDEGTDKLFGKNPSGLWADYAAKIGTTAGKLTDAQKQQALLDAIMTEGAKVQGEYARMMDGPIGATQDLSNATRELQAAGGGLVTEAATPLIRLLADLAGIVNSLPQPIRQVVGVAGMTTSAFVALRVAGITPTLGVFGRMPAVLRLARVQLAATGATAAGPVVLGFRTAGIAVKGFWASLGPVGWAILGITALAEAIALFRGASDEAAESTADWRQEMDGLTDAQLEASIRGLRGAIEASTVTLEAQRAKVRELQQVWQDANQAQAQYNQTGLMGGVRTAVVDAQVRNARDAVTRTEEALTEANERVATYEQQLADRRAERAQQERAQATADQAQRNAAAARQAAAEARRRQDAARQRAKELRDAQAALRLEMEAEVAARRSSLERQALDLERWYSEQKEIASAGTQLRIDLDAEYTARREAMYRTAANERDRAELDIQAGRMRLAGATEAEIVNLYIDATERMFYAAQGGSEEQSRIRLEWIRLTQQEEEAVRNEARARQDARDAEAAERAAQIEIDGATRAASLVGVARVVAVEETEAELSRIRLAALRARLDAQETFVGMTAQQTRVESARLREAIQREQAKIAASSRATAQAVADDMEEQVSRVLDFTGRAASAFWGQLTGERKRRSDEEVALDRERFAEQRADYGQQLRDRELSREDHATRMRELALSESEYEADLAEERESRIRRGARETSAFLIRESASYLAKLARDKVVELAVYTTTEEGKTLVSVGGTAVRIANYIAEQSVALASAGASMVSAAASWIAAAVKRLGLLSIVAIPAGLAGLYGVYQGAKAAFGFERGGYFGRQGEAASDEPVVGLGRGEAVLTRHQQTPVNRALKLVYGTDLGGLFASVTTPHSVSASSLMSAAGLPPGTPVYRSGGIVDVTRASTPQRDEAGMADAVGAAVRDAVAPLAAEVAQLKTQPPPVYADPKAFRAGQAAASADRSQAQPTRVRRITISRN